MKNVADGFSSYYVENRPDGTELTLTGRSRPTSVLDSHRIDDDSQLIAAYLDARDSLTYEQAKQDLYTATYRRQLEEERRRAYEQRQRQFDDHVQRYSNHVFVDEAALEDAIKRQVRMSALPPRPPSAPGRAKTTGSARRVVCTPALGGDLRVIAGDTEGAIRGLHRAALTKAFEQSMEDVKPIKRVAFRSRPSSAAGHTTQHSRKGGHFSGWRDATALDNDLWKMTKYQNIKPKVDNRWTRGTLVEQTRDDGKVDLKLECPQGEEVNVSLRVESMPSGATSRYYR